MAKVYTPQFVATMPKIVAYNSLALEAFGGQLLSVGEVNPNATLFQVEGAPAKAVINDYNKDANTAMGTGAGTGSRFGNMTEIIYPIIDVKVEKEYAINEGLDQMTVNKGLDEAVAERIEANSEALAELVDNMLFAKLVDAGHQLSTASAISVFSDARKNFVNNKVSRNVKWLAYAKPQVISQLIKDPAVIAGKGATVSYDNGNIAKVEGFEIREVPESALNGVDVVFTAEYVGQAATGVEILRAIESEHFAGQALQGAGKLGAVIPDQNKVAVLKAQVAPTA